MSWTTLTFKRSNIQSSVSSIVPLSLYIYTHRTGRKLGSSKLCRRKKCIQVVFLRNTLHLDPLWFFCVGRVLHGSLALSAKLLDIYASPLCTTNKSALIHTKRALALEPRLDDRSSKIASSWLFRFLRHWGDQRNCEKKLGNFMRKALNLKSDLLKSHHHKG